MLLENVLKLWGVLLIVMAIGWFLEFVDFGFDRAIRKILGPKKAPSSKVSFSRVFSAVAVAFFGTVLVAVTYMAGYRVVVIEDNSDLSFGVGIFFGWAVRFLFAQLECPLTNLRDALIERFRAWRARRRAISMVATATGGDTQLAGKLVDFVGEKLVDRYKNLPTENP